jgi:hypothetical protein
MLGRACSLALALALLVAPTMTSTLVLAACRRGDGADEGSSYACRCAMLTDTDGAIERRLVVCAGDRSGAEGRARGCAQRQALGNVQSCSCEPAGRCAGSGEGECREADEGGSG